MALAESNLGGSGGDSHNKEKAALDMQSLESRQSFYDKIQQTPGSWLARKTHTAWHMIYGLYFMFFKLKGFQELCARNRRYDPVDEPRRPGEVVVITGGPRGIAYELAKKFLQLDFIVIMGCRNVTTSLDKVENLKASGFLRRGTIHLLHLNLKSLASTKEFAVEVLKLTSRIDILINNAGVMITPYECTEDGYESQFQINYLGHFLLTVLLLPTIKRTSEERSDTNSCRIINTTSVYHLAGSLDFDDLETKKVYSAPKCYFDSKLCQVLFTKQLEKRLQQEKVNIHVFAVHPGAIPTDLWQNAGMIHRAIGCVVKPVTPTVEDGADAIMYAALSSKLETKGGSYLEGLSLSQPNSEVNNVFYQERLWSRSELFCQAFVSMLALTL